ncbi:hypothetical protein [Sunxiuqinia indica]|uniref:hypothetical protein n=1 Tax=Sunxiuqinia indica TaxID=2692584 RepID=UPI00135A3690|nr:hypothetical protein [Sunxiuqinia indica]
MKTNYSLFKPFLLSILAGLLISSCQMSSKEYILLDENFSELPQGPLAYDVGAHTEYHYLPEASPRTPWIVTTFRYNLPPSWEVRQHHANSELVQTAHNPNKHWHPMVVTGSPFWTDYTIEFSFQPQKSASRNGLVFRYLNDRQYYFAGFEDNKLVLLKVDHGKAFRIPNETELDQSFVIFNQARPINLKVQAEGNKITVFQNEDQIMSAIDNDFMSGKIGLLSDSPTSFRQIKITTSEKAIQKAKAQELAQKQEQDSLISKTPKMDVYKTMFLGDFGVGRNVRFGDLDGDAKIDVLFGQVNHHGPKDRNSELSCLTAMTLDGEILWQIGEPDPWKTMVTNDVAFQIHDVDQDGNTEVIYCKNQELIIAEGATGKTIKKVSTPLTPGGKPMESGHNMFKHILGDAIYFLDLQGKGYDSDFILKDRYQYLWAFDSDLNQLWTGKCRTGHFPYAYDTDQDGKDELLIGYSLFDNDGTMLWSLDDQIQDHADGVAIAQFEQNQAPKILCAASDEGLFYANLDGEITKHHYIGHVQNPAVANFRDDLPGLETVSINFWGNQGIIHLFDKDGEIYHSFEPNQYGSMCLPLNWTGNSEEFFVLNANAAEGGAWDGYGRKVLEFPDDGHPDMCYAVMNIVGDIRDEIVVWDPHQLWVYTQTDNPITNVDLYHPVKNPLYNLSNYQATVSTKD